MKIILCLFLAVCILAVALFIAAVAERIKLDKSAYKFIKETDTSKEDMEMFIQMLCQDKNFKTHEWENDR